MQPSAPIDTTDDSIQVWDPFVRLFHWSLVLLFLFAYLSGEAGRESPHYAAGYLILLLVTARIIWGFVGTPYARFSSFVASPKETLAYLAAIARNRPARHLGHNPAGGAMVVLLLLLLLTTLISGLMTQATVEFEGPLRGLLFNMDDHFAATVRHLHHLSIDLMLVAIAAHLVGVVVASIQHREKLVLSMIHGKKPVEGNHE